MLDVFFATLTPMLMMFFCIVFGFLLRKKKLCPDNTGTVLSKLETYVFCPALILNTFTEYCTVESLQLRWQTLLFSLGITLLAVGLSYPLSALFEKKGYPRRVYRYAMAFANAGFMGNAIVPAILGAEMLYEYLLFCLPLQLFIYSWGISQLVPHKGSGSRALQLLKNPTILAILIGIPLGLSGSKNYLPAFFFDALGALKGCMGPVAMLLTGFVVAGYDFGSLLRKPKVYAASAVRLFLLPSLYVAILLLFGADPLTATLCFFAFGTPLGLNTVVFPAAYGEDTSVGASMAMISHTLCVLTIPLMYSLLRTLLQSLT